MALLYMNNKWVKVLWDFWRTVYKNYNKTQWSLALRKQTMKKWIIKAQYSGHTPNCSTAAWAFWLRVQLQTEILSILCKGYYYCYCWNFERSAWDSGILMHMSKLLLCQKCSKCFSFIFKSPTKTKTNSYICVIPSLCNVLFHIIVGALKKLVVPCYLYHTFRH